MNSRDTFVVVGGVALALWWLKDKITGPGGVVDTTLARPIAYIISKLTLPATFHVPNGVVLPDGGYVSFDAIVSAGGKVNENQEFLWRGVRYKVTRRRTDQNYDAIRA